MANKTQWFIDRSKAKYGPDAFDYTAVHFVSFRRTKYVLLECCTCNETFETSSLKHLSSQTKYGCPYCAKAAAFKTKEEYIEEAEEVHGKGRYDYTYSDYKGYKRPIVIRCTKCNSLFKIARAGNHIMRGFGHCKKKKED